MPTETDAPPTRAAAVRAALTAAGFWAAGNTDTIHYWQPITGRVAVRTVCGTYQSLTGPAPEEILDITELDAALLCKRCTTAPAGTGAGEGA